MILFIPFFKDGGTLIMYPILALLIVVIALFVNALLKPESFSKMKSLIGSIGWFVLAWGYLGRTIGLIKAFDNVAASGDISPSMLSGGLKMALLGPLAGIIVFLIARAFIIIMIMREKKSVSE